MKLNKKRTVCVGFAFFLICAFWQVYDSIVPLLLTNKYGMSQTMSGFIMALDNIFAVFMLPLFGALSDKTRTKYGRRTPYIFFGTIAGAVCLGLLGVMPSAWSFIAVLLLALISMATFRSPAVALMPDVTVKPLRSQGNAVINLMGTAGGILALGLSILFKTSEAGKTDFTAYLVSVGILMLAALAVFLITVREPAWAKDAELLEATLPKEEEETPARVDRRLSAGERASLIFLLLSVALWYIGYNAVTSKYSVYATEVLKVPYNITLMIAQGAAIVAFIPVGMIASRVGRKKTILAGVALLTISFALAAFVKEGTPAVLMYLLFSLAGIGWATINVNSFPMVVELATGSDVGRYTGYYYTASMAAQIVTPVFSGFLVDRVGWGIFFPYAATFAALAFVTMCFVRHGDSRPAPKSGLESLDMDD